MDIREIRKRRLQQLIVSRFGGVMARLAEKIGRQSSYVARVLAENSEHSRNIGEKLAREIERACDLPLGYLDMPFDHKNSMDPAVGPPPWLRTDDDPGDIISPVRYLPSQPVGHEVLLIPKMDDTLPIGVDQHERMFSSIALHTSWIRQHLSITSPSNLAFVAADTGGSMLPSIAHGDLLLVDKGVETFSQDGVYVVSVLNQVAIRRVQRVLEGLKIFTDNRVYEMVIPPDRQREVVTFGRVVYCLSGTPL